MDPRLAHLADLLGVLVLVVALDAAVRHRRDKVARAVPRSVLRLFHLVTVLPAPDVHLLDVLVNLAASVLLLEEVQRHESLTHETTHLRVVMAERRERNQFLGVDDFEVGGESNRRAINHVTSDAARAKQGEEIVEVALNPHQLLVRDHSVGNQLSNRSFAKSCKTESLPQRTRAQIHSVEASSRLVNHRQQLGGLELHVPFLVEVVRRDASRARVEDVEPAEAVEVVPRQQPEGAAVRQLEHLTRHVRVDDLAEVLRVLGEVDAVTCHRASSSRATIPEACPPEGQRH